jgi:hypothetical protein
MRNLLFYCLAASFVLGVSLRDSQGRIIDDFSVGALDVVQGATPVLEIQNGLDPAHVVGGGRRIATSVGGGSAGQAVAIDTLARTFTFESGPSSLGYLSVQYGSAQTPLGLDLTADGATHLAIIFEKTGVTGIGATTPPQFTFNNFPGGGSISFGPSIALGDGRRLARAAFSSHPTIDFSNIGQITFGVVRYPTNATFVIHSIATVPEPQGGVIAGVGALLLLASVRQRRRRFRSALPTA